MMTLTMKRDFLSAVGEELGEAVVPPVAFEDASSHECCEVVISVLGNHIEPRDIANLSKVDLVRLAEGFSAYFGCDAPHVDKIRKAVSRIMIRWPPEP